MDTTLLRKLTYKSTMKFGKYYDLTVQQIFDLGEGKAIKYLSWLYFSADKITFIDEILDRLFISENIRIQKPGKLNNDDLIVYQSIRKSISTDDFMCKTDEEKEKLIKMSMKKSWESSKRRTVKGKIIHNKENSKIHNRTRNQNEK